MPAPTSTPQVQEEEAEVQATTRHRITATMLNSSSSSNSNTAQLTLLTVNTRCTACTLDILPTPSSSTQLSATRATVDKAAQQQVKLLPLCLFWGGAGGFTKKRHIKIAFQAADHNVALVFYSVCLIKVLLKHLSGHLCAPSSVLIIAEERSH